VRAFCARSLSADRQIWAGLAQLSRVSDGARIAGSGGGRSSDDASFCARQLMDAGVSLESQLDVISRRCGGDKGTLPSDPAPSSVRPARHPLT
jgi:hypothetical protein